VAGNSVEVAAGIRQRFGDIATRISLYTPYHADPADLVAAAAALRS
jgi:hypothetical protein